MTAEYRDVAGLRIAECLYEFIASELCPGTGIDPVAFLSSLAEITEELGPKNRQLLARRDELQERIDHWHSERRGQSWDAAAYKAFLQEIGYLLPERDSFTIRTDKVDEEISKIAGPQLVVPVDNARFALNAANARWGSLYDALYGTDVISEDNGRERTDAYNPRRGAEVVSRAEQFLNQRFPLERGDYSAATGFQLSQIDGRSQLTITLAGGEEVGLAQPEKFVGYHNEQDRLASVLLRNHGLHVEIQIDPEHPVGREHPAGVRDVILEAAVTTIQDCEDSVSAVDAEDKTQVYGNWLGIMKGTLEATFDKGGHSITRRLNADREFVAPNGQPLVLHGRSLMLVRNVGIHMFTDAVTSLDGAPIPEGFLDAMVTTLAALHDLQGASQRANSRAGSVYIVKPKLHGPDEVAATIELFSRVEQALGLDRNTIKIGIMDEERRTTVNLAECIRQARERVVFINTGFLDRTGDEIHTSMQAGPIIPKTEIKQAPWMLAYEDWNVDIGNETGLPGRAQIGKGMWAMPDRMREMVEAKIAHPRAGANTAWVPSPTAATLHAMHYHDVNVQDQQRQLAERQRASLADLLTPPLLGERRLDPAQIEQELRNNAQGTLGYVVRWVEQGVGCSKVPDISDVGLMEDRATLRISSQHMANWLHHGIITESQLRAVFEEMAVVVDRQNSTDPNYRSMAANFGSSLGFQAALDLVFGGRREPNGYTENVLTTRRREAKSAG